MTHLDDRDSILAAALAHTNNLKGKKQDLALFDYCAGACHGMYLAGRLDNVCPPWLFVIGVRGGDRVAEAKRMLGEILGEEKPAEEPPVKK